MPNCHLKVTNAQIVDGSGAPSMDADVAVDGDRIAAVGHCGGWNAEETVDGEGLVLCPGFIDVHTHDDLALFRNPNLPFKLSQGVTTVIAGNCGISAAPLGPECTLPEPFPLLGRPNEFRFPAVRAFAEEIARKTPAANVALLAGHTALRVQTMTGNIARVAEPGEIETMQQILRTALAQGCIGVSTGLDYPPAAAATTDEISGVVSVASEFTGAVHATHMRDEGNGVMDAVRETLEIEQRSGVPVVISHHKCAGPPNYGRSVETLAAIDAARVQGQAVALDVYPYTASSTVLLDQFVEDAESVLIADSKPHPECNGKLLERIAATWGCDIPTAVVRLQPGTAIYFQMDENDVGRIISHPASMIGSDGLPGTSRPHPRLWGTFPRVLGRYVRERKLLSLEQAIHKMTGLAAATFGIQGRGHISPGYHADMVLLDPERIIDRADFEHPETQSQGIHSVWVNGMLTWHRQASTQTRNGRFITH